MTTAAAGETTAAAVVTTAAVGETTADNGTVTVRHAPGNLHLMYVPSFVPIDLNAALLNYVRAVTFISKVGTVQFLRGTHVSRNKYRWEVQPELAKFSKAYYNFSHNHHAPLPPMQMGAAVQDLRDACWAWAKEKKIIIGDADDQWPNAVLINWYPDGGAGLSAHGDNDPWFGGDAVLVLSVSIGAERTITFRSRNDKNFKYSLKMHSGSLVAMIGADTQRAYTHEVAKVSSVRDERFNFTFRHIRPDLFAAQHAMRSKGDQTAKYANAYAQAAASALRPDGGTTTADGAAWAAGWQAALAAGT